MEWLVHVKIPLRLRVSLLPYVTLMAGIAVLEAVSTEIGQGLAIRMYITLIR